MTRAARRIIANTAAGSAARIATIAIALLTTPVLVNHLGAEAFGLLTVLVALPAYAGLLDFGIGAGLVKHLTECSEADDAAGVRHVMTLGLACYVLLGLALTPCVYLLTLAITQALALAEPIRRTTQVCATLMVLSFAVSGVAGVFSARLVSLHRMDVAALIGLLGQCAYAALVFAVIPASPTILTAVWLALAQAALTGGLLGLAVARAGRSILCDPRGIPRPLIRRMLAFGGWMQVNALTAVINLEADKLIIAWFLGLASVTPYQIGNRLASLNRVVPFQMLAAMMPVATTVQAGGTRAEAAAFYREMSRYLMLLTLAITGFTVVVADRLIATWIGQPYPEAATIACTLALSLSVNNLTGGGTTMARASGQPRYETYYAVLSMTLNVGLTVVLAPPFGLAGILAGTVVANLVGSVYFLALFHRRFRFPWSETVGDWLWRLLAAMGFACAALALVQTCEPTDLPAGRLAGLALLTLYGVVYLAVFTAGLTLLGFWSAGDRAFLRACVGRAGRREGAGGSP